MKSVKLALSLLLLSSLLVSCGSLHTPEYRTPEEYLQKKAESPQKAQSRITSLSDDISLSWPLNNVKINRGFSQNKKRSKRHLGIDFGGIKGTHIMSAHEGYVIYAGKAFKGYGNMVILENPQGYATFYAHLNEINVREGNYLSRGQILGRMGRTGRATGVHLHFELRISSLPVDPQPFLTKNRLDRSVSQHSE